MSQTAGRFEIGTDGPTAILVGVDGSRSSLRAGSYAAGLARRQGSRLIVLYVTRLGTAAGLSAGVAPIITESHSELGEDLRRQTVAGAQQLGVRADFLTANGDPYDAILTTAETHQVDLIVVGSSESAGHRLIGSIAVRLVRAARWPVVVVP